MFLAIELCVRLIFMKDKVQFICKFCNKFKYAANMGI